MIWRFIQLFEGCLWLALAFARNLLIRIEVVFWNCWSPSEDYSWILILKDCHMKTFGVDGACRSSTFRTNKPLHLLWIWCSLANPAYQNWKLLLKHQINLLEYSKSLLFHYLHRISHCRFEFVGPSILGFHISYQDELLYSIAICLLRSSLSIRRQEHGFVCKYYLLWDHFLAWNPEHFFVHQRHYSAYPICKYSFLIFC